MNIRTFSKTSLIVASIVIAGGATTAQRAYASETGTLPVIHVPTNTFETGTLPVIKAPTTNALSLKKDNGTIPVIVVPSSSNVSGDGGGGSFGGTTYTLSIGMNQATSDDQAITLTSSRPDLIQVPSTAVVPAGSSSTSTTFTVPYSFARYHNTVTVYATSNGVTVSTTINVHYKNEQG